MVPEDTDEDRRAREALVERLMRQGQCRRASTAAALRSVPRHAFVGPNQRDVAYADRPLPIDRGQTISAPHMVATMIDLLAVDAGDRVLEIGTGCGYHAAVMAEVVGAANVFSVEVSSTLAASARERLAALGYDEIKIRTGDGHDGWEEFAPYEAIYLTCAATRVPERLIDQLADGGRFLAPIGRFHQELVEVTKRDDGSTVRDTHGGVRFVQMREG